MYHCDIAPSTNEAQSSWAAGYSHDPRQMTKLERHELESVEKARKLLLAKFFDSSASEKLRKKEAVRQLLGTIIAVREAGMSFEEITTVFSEAGLVLNTNTLRLYFYELKAQAEIAAHEKAHAEQVARTRAQLVDDDRARLSTEALTEAEAQAKKKREAGADRKGFLVPPGAAAPSPAKPAKPERAERPKGARPPAGVAPPPATHALPAAIQRAGEGATGEAGDPPDAAWVPPADTPTSNATPSGTSPAPLAPTIEEALKAGENFTGVRPELRENVVLFRDRVYYESGEAFDGTLTKAQAHLLRTVGKLIAPTIMSSTKDFVKMPSKL